MQHGHKHHIEVPTTHEEEHKADEADGAHNVTTVLAGRLQRGVTSSAAGVQAPRDTRLPDHETHRTEDEAVEESFEVDAAAPWA